MLKLEYTPKRITTLLMGAIMAKKMSRSAWDKGVRDYAVWYILQPTSLDGDDTQRQHWDVSSLRELILNGAGGNIVTVTDEFKAWVRYSEGGCALIYNIDIAKQLCSPSEFKKAKNDIENGNYEVNWIETQARALYQASYLIYETFRQMTDQ